MRCAAFLGGSLKEEAVKIRKKLSWKMDSRKQEKKKKQGGEADTDSRWPPPWNNAPQKKKKLWAIEETVYL